MECTVVTGDHYPGVRLTGAINGDRSLTQHLLPDAGFYAPILSTVFRICKPP
jgi:hypothetical protein